MSRLTQQATVSSGGALAGAARHDLGPRRITMLALGAVLACLTALAFATLPAGTPSSTEPQGLRYHAHSDLSTSPPITLAPTASASIGSTERSFWPTRRGESLVTDGGGIAATFTASGAVLRVAHGALRLSLTAMGRSGRLDPVAAVSPSHSANEVLYRHRSITEFYRSGPFGLEQGFTIPRRSQAGTEPLALALRVGGSLRPQQVGPQILFRTRAGASALRYGELSAVDATGRRLPVSMQLRNGALELRIDDSHAHYPLTIDPFFQQVSELKGAEESGAGRFGENVALSADGNTALISAPTDNGEVGAAWVFVRSGSTWVQQGPKLTGGEEEGKGRFGTGVALSGDGNTALIGGGGDNHEVGAAWVFTRTGETWTQQGPKLTGGEEDGAGRFGFHVALSEDGNTALIGGTGDDGEVGAAWAFTRTGETWAQQGTKLTGGEELGTGKAGEGVALSGDGNTALIGGGGDNHEVGAAWVFTRTGETWAQQGPKLTGSGEIGKGRFAYSVALSEDGNTALIGGGSDNHEAGAAWVFVRSGSTWEQPGTKLTGSGETGKGHFGYSTALSGDGNTALIGGLADNHEVGAAWVFARSGSTWEQQGAKLTGSGEIGRGLFGYGVALSGDGNTALIGGGGDNSAVGAAWVFLGNAAPLPTVTSVTPSSGPAPGGTSVTIGGTGFVAGAKVTIGSEATAVNVVSATEITAMTAATAAGSYNVVVTDANGTSLGGPSYAYIAATPPTVTTVTPSSGSTVGGASVKIKGTGFVAGAKVTIGSEATAVNVVSAKEIKATTAATAAGSYNVVVSDANGTSSGGPSYTYIAPPPPTVTSVTPSSGSTVGTTAVTIKGTGFVAGAKVTIGSEATAVNVVSAKEIKATTAATAAGSYNVVVSDLNGTSSGGPSYTYIAPLAPTVTRVTPSSGSTVGGTPLTIKGTGFVAGAKVTIGSEATAVNVVSAKEIKATTAATAAGSYNVVVSDANGTSSGGPSFTYIAPPPPTVMSVTPSSGSTVGGTPLTIKGTGFVAGAKVTIGSEATAVSVVSATEIMATTVATAAGADQVVVSDVNGVSSGGPSFTYIAPLPPTVASVEPSSGPEAGGTVVTIKGTGFVAGAKVMIGSEATAVSVVSATEIMATTVATAAGADEVVVSDVNGVSSGGPSFTYLAPPPPPPTVASVEPSSGPEAGGTVVTIKGTGFVAGAEVTIGNEATDVFVVSETEIMAVTTATTAGTDEVVVSDLDGTSTGGPSYTYEET